MRRVHALLALLLACGLLLAACGGDDDEDLPEDGAPGVTETAPPDETQTETGPDGAGERPLDAPTEEAIDQCRQSAQAAEQLSPEVRDDLARLCEQAAEGDADAVREATLDVCRKIVEESVPEGTARQRALASCEQAAER